MRKSKKAKRARSKESKIKQRNLGQAHKENADISGREDIEQELSWQAETGAALAELSSALMLPGSIEDISFRVLEYAKKFTNSSYGFVSHINAETGDVICPTLTRDVGEECRIAEKKTVFKNVSAQGGLGGWVWENKKPLISNVPSADPRSRGVPDGHVPIHRFLGVPAMMGETFVGMLALANSDHDYSDRDLVFAERLATLYAIAVARLRSEETLRQSEQRFRHLVENLLEGIWVIDQNACCTFVNDAMAEMLGYAPDEMLGKHLFSFMDEAHVEICKRNLERRRQGIKEEHEFEFLRKDGSRIYTRLITGPIIDDDGNYRGAIASVADITARKKAEDAMRESEERYRLLSQKLEVMVAEQVKKLRQAETLAGIGQMVSVVAHEIRNPLHIMRMGIDALQKAIGNDEGKLEILREIRHGANLMNGIVCELLEYSRTVRLDRAQWSIGDIIQKALGFAEDNLESISVHVDLESKEIFVDGDKVTRVFTNLISNAIDAMPSGGRLEIRSQRGGDDTGSFLTVSVSDTGCGISEELLERIQEPFFTTKTKGTGLGLPICKKIIEAHKGVLSIRSKVNEGTTVEIKLPTVSF